MSDDKIFLDFNPNDFIIRISPFIDDQGAWTGELHVGSCTTDENTLSDEDYINLMQLTPKRRLESIDGNVINVDFK